MKRYQELIRQHNEKDGVRKLARNLEVPAQSLSNYLLDGTEPRSGNLEKMSKFFGEPVSALLMEVGEEASVENQIIDMVGKLNKTQKKAVLKFMKGQLK